MSTTVDYWVKEKESYDRQIKEKLKKLKKIKDLRGKAK
jgi:hypothetical protein